MDIRLLCLLGVMAAISDCSPAHPDPLRPGNRRVDMHETACSDNGGAVHNLDIFGCHEFDCGDGTKVPVPQGTPCKRLFDFGHCLNGDCMSAADYMVYAKEVQDTTT